jgi:hypothetical protein
MASIRTSGARSPSWSGHTGLGIEVEMDGWMDEEKMECL